MASSFANHLSQKPRSPPSLLSFSHKHMQFIISSYWFYLQSRLSNLLISLFLYCYYFSSKHPVSCLDQHFLLSPLWSILHAAPRTVFIKNRNTIWSYHPFFINMHCFLADYRIKLNFAPNTGRLLISGANHPASFALLCYRILWPNSWYTLVVAKIIGFGIRYI